MSGEKTIETEGATVEEALDEALASLGATRDEVDVEVLASPSRGLFGLGGRQARVKVTRRATERRVAPTNHGDDQHTGGASNALAEHGRDLLADLLQRMGFQSEVAVEKGAEGPLLEISGDNTNVLIGKHGQTLDALEYYINRVVSREVEVATRIHLDCERYRVKRRRSLELLAQKMGDEAKRKGRAVALDPMSPRDRRVVHLALQADPRLSTRSSGEGYYRTLVITPEGGSGGRSRSRGR